MIPIIFITHGTLWQSWLNCHYYTGLHAFPAAGMVVGHGFRADGYKGVLCVLAAPGYRGAPCAR